MIDSVNLMQIQHGSHTDVGMKRDKNQDHHVCMPEIGLYVVADGMGGHLGGETASQVATEVIPAHLKRALATIPSVEITDGNLSDATRDKIGQYLEESIRAANQTIFDIAKKDSSLQGMGTTTTALLIIGNCAWVGHVGDSRCYFIRTEEGSIWQLTRDHSWVQEKLRAGIITRAQVKTDRMKNVITRSVGFELNVDVDIYTAEVHAGDTFLLCSDGLTGHLDDLQILQFVKKGLGPKPDSMGVTSKRLIEEANLKGGDDNITVILVRVPE
jgi:protein phosphatase